MKALKPIALLVVSALLLLPMVARASDINIQTDAIRVTVDTERGIKIEPRGIATKYPNQGRSPADRYRNWGSRNCNWVHLNQRFSQTSSSSSGVSQTHSSTSTRVCR